MAMPTTFPKASDLARPAAGIFYVDALLLEVANSLVRAPGQRAVVLDDSHKLVGFVSEPKLLKALLIAMTNNKTLRLRDQSDLLDPALAISSEMKFPEILKQIVQSPRGLLVQDFARRVLGVVGVRDVLEALVRDTSSEQSKRTLQEAQTRVQAEVHDASNVSEALLLYQGLFESSPYMIHSLDAKGRVLIGNRAFHAALGYPPGALHGKTFQDLYSEKHWQAAERGLREIMEKGTSTHVKTSMKHRDGSLLPVDLRSTVLKDSSDKFVGTISVARRLDNDEEVHSIMELIGIFDEVLEKPKK